MTPAQRRAWERLLEAIKRLEVLGHQEALVPLGATPPLAIDVETAKSAVKSEAREFVWELERSRMSTALEIAAPFVAIVCMACGAMSTDLELAAPFVAIVCMACGAACLLYAWTRRRHRG
jgi:hypothetical protein